MGDKGATTLGKKISNLLNQFSDKTQITVGWISIHPDDPNYIRVQFNVDLYKEWEPKTRSYIMNQSEVDFKATNYRLVSYYRSKLQRKLTSIYQRHQKLYPDSCLYIPRMFMASRLENGSVEYKVDV